MTNTPLFPADIAPPFGNYSHAVEVPPGARTLHIAGQVGVTPDGTLAGDAGSQTTVTLDNIERVLAAAGMTMADVVKLVFYVASADDLPAIRDARDRRLKAPFPAMSLVIVRALAQPGWRLEVDGIAARAPD